MIRFIIFGTLLSMLSGTLGAGLAACRNGTSSPAVEAESPPGPSTTPPPARSDGCGPRSTASATRGARPSAGSSA